MTLTLGLLLWFIATLGGGLVSLRRSLVSLGWGLVAVAALARWLVGTLGGGLVATLGALLVVVSGLDSCGHQDYGRDER